MKRLALAILVVTSMPSIARGQSRLYYEQAYLPASHNWAFAKEFPRVDRLFNAFDYGHSILYETLWQHPSAATAVLDVQEFDFITRRLLTDPPRVPLDEAAIGPGWSLLAPEVLSMFEWAHMLHRQVYDVIADDRIKSPQRDARVADVVRYYKSRPAVALSSHPKDMALMEGQPYSLAFRKRFPRYNGLIWSYHWLQMTIYDAMLAADTRTEEAANVKAVTDRFWAMIRGQEAALPSMMPMSAAIAPIFSERYSEAAIIFDNLHSLHDVVSDILANPSVPRSRKRSAILEAARKYRDSTSNVTTIDEWRAMSAEMDLDEMGGPAPGAKRQKPPAVGPGHKH